MAPVPTQVYRNFAASELSPSWPKILPELAAPRWIRANIFQLPPPPPFFSASLLYDHGGFPLRG